MRQSDRSPIRYCVFEIACHLAADKGRLFTSIGFLECCFCDIALVINLVSLRLSVYYQNDGALISNITSRVTCAKHGI